MPENISFVYKIIGLFVFAYLLGSIPFGFLLGQFKGIDIREHGSKNIGATNAGRVLGKKFFYLSLFADVLKGFIPTFSAGIILFQTNSNSISPQWLFLFWILVSFFAVAGHNWPVWLNFKGGKGVATSLGVVLAIYPYYTVPGILGFAIWIILVKTSGYVSIGSVTSAIIFVATYFFMVIIIDEWSLKEQWPLLVFSILMSGVLIFRHRSNIRRLLDGKENKFFLK